MVKNSSNNKALRVVTGTGGGTGGSNSFTSAFPSSKPVSGNFPISGTVGNHTLTSNQLPSHTHANGGSVTLSPGGGDVRSGGGWSRSTPSTGNNTTNAAFCIIMDLVVVVQVLVQTSILPYNTLM